MILNPFTDVGIQTDTKKGWVTNPQTRTETSVYRLSGSLCP